MTFHSSQPINSAAISRFPVVILECPWDTWECWFPCFKIYQVVASVLRQFTGDPTLPYPANIPRTKWCMDTLMGLTVTWRWRAPLVINMIWLVQYQ
ncbi:peroxisomal n -acetyl-spermine spermidine oxidase-like protein, partial [Lasius niger]